MSSPDVPLPPAPWSLPRRVAFRFAFLVAALEIFPFPLGFVPWTSQLGWILFRPWFPAVSWFARVVLRLPEPSTTPTGSGDGLWFYVQLLLIAILATIGTVAWSVIDRRRVEYSRLAAAVLVLLRYWLAIYMMSYGFAKLAQFPVPSPQRLDGRIGDMSPMGLLWTFMGYSTPYSLFTGGVEATGGFLLLWRRTRTAGALLVVAGMANVVALNFCYDVPVKLLSMKLLAAAVAIASPDLRRVSAALLGYATPAAPARPKLPADWERMRQLVKGVMIASMAVRLFGQYQWMREYERPKNELHGIWAVEEFVSDGTERPPLMTDRLRWRKLVVSEYRVTLRMVNDDVRGFWRTRVDESAHVIELQVDLATTERLRYARPDPEHLVIDGAFLGKQLHVELTREPDPLLVTRGFHWIQELPFNR